MTSRTILLVDDDAALLGTLSLNLRARGHEVLTADTGEGALEVARAEDAPLTTAQPAEAR